jgi:hypothetical protein
MTSIYKELTHRDLTARGGYRIQVFLDKIKEGKPFLTKKGEIVLDKDLARLIKTQITKSGFSMDMLGKLKGRNTTVNYPKDFYKTPELGGKGTGSGTAAEDRHLAMFRKKLEEVLTKSKTSTIKMKVGGRVVTVAGIESTSGTPKSDFHLIDKDGKQVAWISHKDGTKASQFQQYGGLTKEFNTHYSKSKDVMNFLNDVKKLRPKGLQRNDSLWRYVKDKQVAKYTIWGPDYGKSRGINNVDEFHQGEMMLVKAGAMYEIHSLHKEINGAVPKNAGPGDYTPIYVARFTSDRGGLGIDFARIGVFARAYVSNKALEI